MNQALHIRLRIARENAGYSQKQAAIQLKLYRETITEIEAGRRKISTQELFDFMKLYKLDISWLKEELTQNA